MLRVVVCCCLLTALTWISTGCRSSSTPPIAGGIATLETVSLGGEPQWILIRGRSAASPLVLKLHGGPGQAEMATVRFNDRLEQDFLVVEWDQRGAGKSADVPAERVTMEQIVSDTIELSVHLLKR